MSPPLCYVANAKSEVAQHPDDIDRAMREAWDAVYAGNGPIVQTAVGFVDKYFEFLYHEEPQELPELDART
eukprot:12558807-Alexandrium_andersonii.AAC.1